MTNIIQTIASAFKPTQPNVELNTFVLSKEEFLQFREAFKAKAKAKTITSADILLYNLVRNKDPKNGFTPITSQVKLNNGMYEWMGYTHARFELDWKLSEPRFNHKQVEYTSSVDARRYRESWGEALTPEFWQQIKDILKGVK